MLTFSERLSDGSVLLKVSGIPNVNLNNLGILMTLSILLMTGATDSAFPHWKVGEMLSFLPLPTFMAEATILHLLAISALYK